MAAKVRRQYAGAAAQTSITSSITSGDTSVSIASTTGWPSTASVPFYVVIDPDTSVEEKCSVTISGSTLTLTRGVDGTVAAAHSSGATIYPVFTAVDADEANELASKFTAKGDIVTQGASTFTTTTVGTNNQLLKADSSAAGGVAWATYSPVITLGGDLTGSVTLTNLGSGTLTATVAANSVALGTDTTGNYVSDVTAGTGITVTHTPGEGSSAAVAIDGTVATLTGSQTLTNKTVALGSNTVSGTKAQFDTAVTDDNFAYVGTANTFTTNQVISASSSSDLLRITQTGAGNALLVEDITNPDSTPFLIDQTGNIVTGHTSALSTIGYSGLAATTKLQLQGTNGSQAGLSLTNWANNSASGPQMIFNKSMSGTIGTAGTTAANNDVGAIVFNGDDGTSFVRSSLIFAEVDGTVSTGVVPGRLMFYTTDSAGTTTERMRIDSSGLATITGTAVITSNASSDALRITQTGAGNALVVEDSTNPDSTPTIIDATGRVVVGATTATTTRIGATTITAPLQILGTTNATASSLFGRYSNDVTAPNIFLAKSRDTSIGSFTTVAAADQLGVISFAGADGTQMVEAARITVLAEGTVSTGVVPGLLTFLTASSAGTLTERMRINSSGQVGIGVTPSAGRNFTVGKTLTGGTTAFGIVMNGVAQSDVTVAAQGVRSAIGTAAESFTLPVAYHFFAAQGTFGAGSTVTTQTGFAVDSGMTGATNNFGFYGTLADATGRFNLYMEGTAANYLAGRLGVGGLNTSGVMAQVVNTTAADVALLVQGAASQTGNLLTVRNSAATNLVTIGSGGAFSVTSNATGSAPFQMNAGLSGATSAYGILVQSTIASDVTSSVDGFRTGMDTAAASFTLETARHFTASNITVGAGSTVTNQIGFYGGAMSTGTNNFAFYGDMSAASGRWNLYMNGTANNYLAENLLIGMTTVATSSSKTVHIGNGTAPTANPSNGGVLYVESGALKYRGSSGTITTIANA